MPTATSLPSPPGDTLLSSLHAWGRSGTRGTLWRRELGEWRPRKAQRGTGHHRPAQWHCQASVTPGRCLGTPRHEKPDSENIPPIKHQHHQQHQHREPDAKTRGEGDGRGSEKMERKPSERADSKKDPLAKTNGLAGQEPISEPGSPYPEGPRGLSSAERVAQPNGWPYPSPSRPGSTALPPGGDGDSGAQRRGVTPRSHPEKVAQRKSSMTQLQQWVNSRRATGHPEELRR